MDPTPRYRLAQHVVACASGAYGVLLDLKRAEYLGIGPIDHAKVSAIVLDWPPGGLTSQANSSSYTDLKESICDMLQQGFLVEAGAPRAPVARRPTFTTAEFALVPGYVRDPVPVTSTDVARFVVAVLRARTRLKFLSLQAIVRGFRRRQGDAGIVRDLDDARRRVLVFRKLRPLLFTSKDACLLDSLALKEFLRFYHHEPELIIGVKVTPFFSAHAWLQLANVVFNDSPLNVVGYSPILAA